MTEQVVERREPAPQGPVLAFDCAGPWLMAGLSGQPMRREEMAKGQAERLLPFLSEVLTGAGLGFADLPALVVGTGPGNFTGIRIAVAAARGLALSLKIPAVGVSLFEVQAALSPTTGARLISLAAPQGRAYLQSFDGAAPRGRPQVLLPGEGGAEIAGSPLVSGFAAAEVAAGLGLRADVSAPWSERADFDLPAQMIALGLAKLRAGDLARPAPLYVRPPDAAPPSDPPPVILDA